jgi:hypothetical protein
MSLVFDSIWHWREEYQARGRGTLDGKCSTLFPPHPELQAKYSTVAALKQPTKPDSANESSSASSTHMDSTLMPPHGIPGTLNIPTSSGGLTPNGGSGLVSTGAGGQNSMLAMSYDYNDVWDPTHWMLDGLLDFNYTFVPPLEGA